LKLFSNKKKEKKGILILEQEALDLKCAVSSSVLCKPAGTPPEARDNAATQPRVTSCIKGSL